MRALQKKCHSESGDAKEQPWVAQVAVSSAHDDAKVAREQASMFETENVAEVGRRREEVGEVTKQSRQQVASATAGTMELGCACRAELAQDKNCLLEGCLDGELEKDRLCQEHT